MKKMFFFAATAAIALASCAKEETLGTVPEAKGEALGFSAYNTASSGAQSKAGVVNSNSDFAGNNGSFGVFGYQYDASDANSTRSFIKLGNDQTGNDVKNMEVSPDGNTGTKWTYSTPGNEIYWLTEATQNFEFYTYSPYCEVNTDDNIVTDDYNTIPSVAPDAAGAGLSFKFQTRNYVSESGKDRDEYFVPTPKKTTDLMYAITTGIAGNKKGTVELNFQHALSQIGVQLTIAEGYYIEVDSVQLTGIKNTGTFTAKKATETENAVKWTELGNNELSGTMLGAIWMADDLVDPTNLNGQMRYILGGATETNYDLTDPKIGYMAIPQEFEAAAGVKPGFIDYSSAETGINTYYGPKLQLHYKMWKGMPTDATYSDSINPAATDNNTLDYTETFGRLAIPLGNIVTTGDGTDAAADWVQGYKYLYHITITGANGNPELNSATVIFKANVETWSDATTGSVDF